MKKTMLTYRTLDRFEREYETAHYTAAEIETIELCAYVANMNQCNHPEWTDADIFADFLRCLASPYKHIDIIPKNPEPTEPETTETEPETNNEEDTTMANYYYTDVMSDDVRAWIANEIDRNEWIDDRDGLEEHLNDTLFCEDSITGNGSGSYFCNAWKAREAVLDNMALCTEALEMFDTPKNAIAEHFLKQDWEYFDVTIRCYMLGAAICTVLDELEDAGYFDESEEDTSDIDALTDTETLTA